MNIKNSVVIGLMLIQCGCISLVKHQDETLSSSKVEEYKEVDFSNLYEKDRSFQALDSGISALMDGILISSKNNNYLSKKQSKLLGEYVRQNKLFCKKGFDQKWIGQLIAKLSLLQKSENNRIAPVVSTKIQELFTENRCGSNIH